MKLVPFLKLVFKTVFKTGFLCGKIRAKTPKITPHRHRSKNHSSEFLSEAGTDQKNSSTKKLEPGLKQNQLHMFEITYLLCINVSFGKDFRPSRLGGRINLETFQKFEGKEEKNQDQTQHPLKLLKTRRFHDIFKDFTKWIPNLPIFPAKLTKFFAK